MRTWYLRHWKFAVLLIATALVAVGCGEDEGPLEFNECGGEGIMDYDGSPADVGDACGPCDRGALVCGGEGTLKCEDPDPTNECGGCEELDSAPGGQCSDAQGFSGEWQCDGEEALQCNATETNSCGGSTVLTNEPGESCGSCGLDVYDCDTLESTVCVETEGCPAARDVAASQGTRDDSVLVTWRGSVLATGYRIYRDGTEIAELSAGNLSYVDDEIDPAGAPENVVVTASSDQTDGVALNWHAEAADATVYEYQVEIVYASNNSELSEVVEGFPGSDVERFELSIDGDDWIDQGTETELFHGDADMATVDPLNAYVDDADYYWISLAADEPVVSDNEHSYVVRAVSTGGDSSESDPATGVRAYGDISYEWSVDIDGTYEELADCADALTCLDDEIPDEYTERDYRFTVSGDGVETAQSEFSGAVELAELEVLTVPQDEYEVNEFVEFDLQLVDSDGEPVAWETVYVGVVVKAGDGTVLHDGFMYTQADGSVSPGFTPFDADEGMTMIVTADHPRVSDAEIIMGPFDAVDPE